MQIQPPTSTNMLDSHILCKITIRFKIVHVVSRCQKKNLLTKNSFFCYIFHSSYIECHKCIIYARRLSAVFIVWNSYNIFSCTKKNKRKQTRIQCTGKYESKVAAILRNVKDCARETFYSSLDRMCNILHCFILVSWDLNTLAAQLLSFGIVLAETFFFQP